MSEQQIFAKCAWRLMPLIMVIYFVNLLDRVNVGFAALTMNRDLGFSPAVYGFGAGLFFLGYLLFQVPANLILERVGARRWIFCILAAWGVVSTATAAVQTPGGFYALRVLLGLAEAGFFPGMMLYMTYWFPQGYRARFAAGMMSAGSLAFVFGGPLSSLILEADGFAGLHGWQWLFLIEGAPAVFLAFAVLKFLPDGPQHASWLDDEQKRVIATRLAADPSTEHSDVWSAIRDVRVLALALAYVGQEAAVFGLALWLPQIVQGMGASNLITGFLVALPYLAGSVAMNLWARSSDAREERTWHVVVPAFLITACLIVSSVVPSDEVVFVVLSLAIVSYLSVEAPFWAIPPILLSGTAAAAGFAFINAVGTGLGGFMGPWVIGLFREASGDYSSAMAALALGPAVTAVIVLVLGRSMISRPAFAQQPAGMTPHSGGGS